MIDLLAQASATDVNSWTALFAPLGVAGILAWHLWYSTSVAAPKLMERVDSICANHDRSQKEAIVAFRDEMKFQRESHRDDLHILMDGIACRNFVPNQPTKGKT